MVNLTASINLSPTIWTLFSLQWASRPLLNTSNENKILVSRCIMTNAYVGETVPREKALDFGGCNFRPQTGSLHPMAIDSVVSQ